MLDSVHTGHACRGTLRVRARARLRTMMAVLGAPALLLASAACADPSPTAPAADTARPFYAGAYLGQRSNAGEIGDAIGDFGALVGKRPALVKTFHDLDADFSRTGGAGRVLREVADAGSTNFVALDLRWDEGPSSDFLATINSGAADDRLRRAARGMADVSGTVMVELAWEMNGDWDYPWQGVHNDDSPAAYVAAWKRVVEIFRAEGAGDVRWVFAPNVGNAVTNGGSGPGHWNWYGHYYPGDDYVDYLAPHGYNGPSVWGGRWRSLDRIFDGGDMDALLTDMERRYPDKPIIVGEFASEESDLGDKGEWIRQAFRALRAHPNVIGAVWFHRDKEADWRVDSSQAALQAYRDAMADPAVLAHFDDAPTRLAAAD